MSRHENLMGRFLRSKNSIAKAKSLLVISALAQAGFALPYAAAPAFADDGPLFKVPTLSGSADANAVRAGSAGEGDTSAGAGAATGSTDLAGKDGLTVEDVTIEGNRLVPAEQILNVVKTRRGDKFDRDQVVQDLKAVNGMGYFDDRSLQAVPELSSNGVLLKIRVQENAPVTEFAFQGNTVMSNEDLAKLFSDQLGKPQNLTQLSGAIDKVEQSYHDKGFTLARVIDVKDDPDGSVHLQIDEGVINSVQIVGNKKTKDFIIRNNIKLKPGTVYNEKQLTGDLRKLYANGYFQDIRRSLSPSTSDPDKYDLKVEVDEKRTGSVGLGGGVDAIAGPFGSFSFSDSNFRGRGQIVSFNSQMGSGMFGQFSNAINNGGSSFMPTSKTYQVEASYIDPNFKGTNTALAVTPFARNLGSMLLDNSMQRSLGTNVNFSRKLGEKWNAGLSFLGEDVFLKSMENLNNSSPIVQRAMQLGKANQFNALAYANGVRNKALQGGTYFGVTPSIAYDTRDQVFDPQKGTFARISGGPNIALNGSSFLKAGASVTKYKSVGKDKVLAFNVQGGSGLGGMPAFGSYNLGGFNGIRGYKMFSDLGYGTSMLMASAEFRMPLPLPKGSASSKSGMIVKGIHDNVRFVAFADAGGVGGNSLYNSLYSRGNMGAAVGLGLRMKVPYLGLIRLDYGIPLIAPVIGGMKPRFTVGFGDKF